MTKVLITSGPAAGSQRIRLETALKEAGFDRAFTVEKADIVIVMLPADANTHADLGVAIGMAKKTILFRPDPELERICARYQQVTAKAISLQAALEACLRLAGRTD